MATDRKLLTQALIAASPQERLLQGQQTSNLAMNSGNFGGGQARGIGLAAQLATAGIGAFSQYKARQEMAEIETATRESFKQSNPQFADIADTLSADTINKFNAEKLAASLKAPETQILSGEGGYFSVDKNTLKATPVMSANGQVIKPQKPASTTINVGEQQGFKNETQLRGEYFDKSKDFIAVKGGFEKVKESLKDPSPVGDIAAIYGFMKAQDPTSTVRESEFATLDQAKPLLEKYGLESYKTAWEGRRLTPNQRNDILTKTAAIYNRANKSQERITNQYTDIAKRSNLNPQNVISDFGTTIEDSQTPKAPSGFKIINIK